MTSPGPKGETVALAKVAAEKDTLVMFTTADEAVVITMSSPTAREGTTVQCTTVEESEPMMLFP